MPVFPFEPRPLTPDGDYPHMGRADAAIWERFIERYGGNFQAVVYDVALGGALPDDAEAEEAYTRAWRYATAVKVDAVLLQPDRAWACEVKPRANTSAVGQALCYAVLLEADGAAGLEVMPMIVTDVTTPDIRFCCEELGVVLVEVGVAPPPDALAGPPAEAAAP